MNGKLASKDEQLKKAEQDNQLKDQTIKDLQSKVSNLDESMQAKTQTDEEYSAQIQQLASMYSKMTPSKSAPIIENMTPNEGVLILSAMRPDDRVRVLEKMNPKRAAEVTSLLKDPVPVKDRQTAALQERAKLNESQASKTGAPMSREDVGQTFASMTPRSAATVLLEMQKSNPDKVLAILNSMDSASRSKVLTSLSELSKETAALITSRLVAQN